MINIKNIRNIALVRPDRLGDTIISTPYLSILSSKFPDSNLFFVARKNFKSLFYNHSIIKKFVSIPIGFNKNGNKRDYISFLKKIKSFDLDIVFFLEPNLFIEKIFFEALIPIRIGFFKKRWEKKYLTNSIKHKKKLGLKHESQYPIEFLKFFNFPKNKNENLLNPPILGIPPKQSLDSIKKKLGCFNINLEGNNKHKYVIFHIGAHKNKPRIPILYFKKIGKFLLKNKELFIILVGKSQNDLIYGEKIKMQLYSKRIINFCCFTSLSELFFLIKFSIFIISRDSGPSHLSAALNIPTITIFLQTPNHPNAKKRWTPIGKKSYLIWAGYCKQYFWDTEKSFLKRYLKNLKIKNIFNIINKIMMS
jgi:heptosyltransferase-1